MEFDISKESENSGNISNSVSQSEPKLLKIESEDEG